MPSSSLGPLINSIPPLQEYYVSLKSRIGYRLVLGRTRHMGYYNEDTYWPFLFTRALRAMEDHLFDVLGLPKSAEVIDAGCGYGHVAIHLAQRGLRVHGIDLVDRHIEKARRNIKAKGLNGAFTVRKMDYHHMGHIPWKLLSMPQIPKLLFESSSAYSGLGVHLHPLNMIIGDLKTTQV